MDNFYSELIHASNEGHTDSEEYVEETLYRFKTFVSRLNPKEVIKMMLSRSKLPDWFMILEKSESVKKFSIRPETLISTRE